LVRRLLDRSGMIKAILDRHEWAVDLGAAILCASALAHAYSVALDRPRSPAPPAMVIATAEAQPRQPDQWGIRKLDGRSFVLDRRAAEALWSETAGLGGSLPGRLARMVPEIHDGQAVGFRLYAVGARGALAALGFQNGDVIQGINGFAFTTPEKALEAYAVLKSADHFLVGFERNGQPLTNEYWLR
jgi:general secretion pathway protein C